MQDQAQPIEIRYLSLNLTPEVGANDILLNVRIVPDGRDGKIVYARTLRRNEEDDGSPVFVNAADGERLEFRQNSIEISIEHIDSCSKPGSDGYAPITNTIWTWMYVSGTANPDQFRFLLAAARRLDASHLVFCNLQERLSQLSTKGLGLIGQRELVYSIVGMVEILIISLNRSLQMLSQLQSRFGMSTPIPKSIDDKLKDVKSIRDAYEHIEDRALGKVHGNPHPDALSVFDNRDFFSNGKVTYSSHSIDIRQELPQLFLEARSYIYNVAVEICGPAMVHRQSISFFEQVT